VQQEEAAVAMEGRARGLEAGTGEEAVAFQISIIPTHPEMTDQQYNLANTFLRMIIRVRMLLQYFPDFRVTLGTA
jgi:hypothetical protein